MEEDFFSEKCAIIFFTHIESQNHEKKKEIQTCSNKQEEILLL
jgi:hypothetical protein